MSFTLRVCYSVICDDCGAPFMLAATAAEGELVQPHFDSEAEANYHLTDYDWTVSEDGTRHTHAVCDPLGGSDE